MAFISEKHKFVFIHIPKTGGTSIVDTLVRMEGGMLRKPREYFEHEGIGDYFPAQFRPNGITTHDTWWQMQQKMPELSGYQKFAVVRNSWDRSYSYYQHKKRRRDMDLPRTADAKIMAFANIFRISHVLLLQPQLYWLTNTAGEIDKSIALLDFEQLGAEYARFMQDIGVDTPALTKLNTNPDNRDYRPCYDDISRETVRAFYRAEIDQLGYTFE